MEIWIVEGSTGEWSDRSEWQVEAWTTEEAAQERVVFLTQKMREIQLGRDIRDVSYEEWQKMKEFDPKFSIDYSGAHYTCYPVELKVK